LIVGQASIVVLEWVNVLVDCTLFVVEHIQLAIERVLQTQPVTGDCRRRFTHSMHLAQWRRRCYCGCRGRLGHGQGLVLEKLKRRLLELVLVGVVIGLVHRLELGQKEICEILFENLDALRVFRVACKLAFGLWAHIGSVFLELLFFWFR
jgi:hypothetical protein